MPPKNFATKRIDPDADAQREEVEDRSPVLPSPTRDTVTVACRLPNGHILRLFRFVDEFETSPLGTRTWKKPVQDGPVFKLNGCAFIPGVMATHTINQGYGLTPNVPRDFWEKWCEQNKDSELLLNRVIFAHAKNDSVMAQARDQSREKVDAPHMTKGHIRGVPSGLEPLDRDNLPRVGLGMRVTTAGAKSPLDD